MTKKNEKNLSWKLKDLPTASELKDLVDADIISAEEAREMAFGSAESDKEVIKTLQEQIKFLQDMVKELSKNRTVYLPTITREIHVQKPYFEKYWMNTNKVLGDAGYKVTSGFVQTAQSLPNSATLTTSRGTESTYFTANANSQPSVMTMSVSPVQEKVIS